MKHRQAIFILTAVSQLYFYYFSFNIATSVIPGWHTTVMDYRPVVTCLYFLMVALLYGVLPSNRLPAWYFWLHAVFSIAPILFMITYDFTFPSDYAELTSIHDSWLYSAAIDLLFFLNQVIFIIIIYVKTTGTQLIKQNINH